MGNYRKAHYRKRNGDRLSASEYKARRKREIIFHFALMIIALVLCIVGLLFLIKKITHKKDEVVPPDNSTQELTVVDTIVKKEEKKELKKEAENPMLKKSEDASAFFEGYDISISDDTAYISSENTISTYALLLDLDNGKVIASKDGNVRINPASMTKILTLLVAVEHIDNLDDTFVMTQEIGNYVYSNDCSCVGLKVGDKLTIRDLLYGTILPSGADASMCLAEYVAGSQEEFVNLMNEKLEELGLSDTAHFTNCIGIYDEDHYCTLMDMAMILKAAEENEVCNEILNTRTYVTSPTSEHPEGITISNWFLRRIEDKDTHGQVTGAKTGFVNQSGCCAASYQVSNNGNHYICVTADSYSTWRCIYDHVDIYSNYTS
ncbi:D-alanyl-D-alanine carboxypeptidase [Butyrivibrio sp. X503]|uniref:D-alanyl-D-alanine carboxypeptidase family protein n=1 Tax=Butyrivibrio sp. X503 TaxID=2364878 RepID=UPI000EAA5E7B|nr:serine hydrolase [Butyrivibrio sp. X503]RKM57160.1 D-alanyl-D-alanine carboxypeptidase [Butyrivibrio sp. X503]